MVGRGAHPIKNRDPQHGRHAVVMLRHALGAALAKLVIARLLSPLQTF
jgi:hypothetical protein